MGKKKPTPDPKAPADAGKKKRNSVFLSLDDATAAALDRFIDAQRIKPSAPSVAFTALVEFLIREGYPPEPAK